MAAINAFYPQFDVIRIDANGYRIVLDTEEIDRYNVTKDIAWDPVFTTADGILPAKGVTVAMGDPGDVIEFSSASYPLTLRFELGSTADDAVLRNLDITYVAENLYTETPSSRANIYIQDLDNTTSDLIPVGQGDSGTSIYVPIQNSIAKNYRVFPFAIDEQFNQERKNRFSQNYQDVSVPAIAAPAPAALFSFYADVGSTTGGADLCTGLIPENTYDADGASVSANYEGEFAANGNTKTFDVTLDGNNIFTASVTKSGGAWKLVVETVRSGVDTVRCHVTLSYPTGTIAQTYTTDVVVDPASPMLLTLTGTSTANNDFAARMGYGWYLKAPPAVAVEYLTGGGDFLTGGGDLLTE